MIYRAIKANIHNLQYCAGTPVIRNSRNQRYDGIYPGNDGTIQNVKYDKYRKILYIDIKWEPASNTARSVWRQYTKQAALDYVDIL